MTDSGIDLEVFLYWNFSLMMQQQFVDKIKVRWRIRSHVERTQGVLVLRRIDFVSNDYVLPDEKYSDIRIKGFIHWMKVILHWLDENSCNNNLEREREGELVLRVKISLQSSRDP